MSEEVDIEALYAELERVNVLLGLLVHAAGGEVFVSRELAEQAAAEWGDDSGYVIENDEQREGLVVRLTHGS